MRASAALCVSMALFTLFPCWMVGAQFGGTMPDVETAAAPPKSTATAKDKQCAACREAVVSTVKRLQPMLTQGTKLAVTLALENPCDQQHLQSGSFNPPTLARACAEWLNESGETLEQVLLEELRVSNKVLLL